MVVGHIPFQNKVSTVHKDANMIMSGAFEMIQYTSVFPR